MGYLERASEFEYYLENSNQKISKMEYESFCINGKHLMPKEQVITEYSKIKATFAFDTDFEYEKYTKFNALIKKLGALVASYDKLTIEQKEILKKVIVYLDLELGTKVSFCKTFIDMKKNRELLINYEMLNELGKFDLDTLFSFYGRSVKKEKHTNFKENIKKTLQNINYIETTPENNEKYKIADYAYQLNCLCENLSKENNISKEKTADFMKIIKSLFTLISGLNLTEEDKEFIEKTIVYLELETGTNVSYLDTFMNMITDGQLELDYDELKENGNLTIEKIAEIFRRKKGNDYSGISK